MQKQHAEYSPRIRRLIELMDNTTQESVGDELEINDHCVNRWLNWRKGKPYRMGKPRFENIGKTLVGWYVGSPSHHDSL